jgi:hypothetical protein
MGERCLMGLSVLYRPGYAVQSATRVELDGWSCGAPGDVDNDGTVWFMAPLDGWHEAPTPRLNLEPRPSEHGAFDGNAYNDPRVVTITGKAVATSLANAKRARDIVASVCGDPSLGLQTMTVYTAGNPALQAAVRRSGITKTAPIGGSYGFVFSIIVTAPDPRRYSTTLLQPSVGLPLPGSGGLAFPLVFPLTFGSGAAGGQMTLTNGGTTAVWPVWSVLGPVDGLSITNLTTGQTLTFDPTFSIPAGQTLVIDTDARSVKLQGVNRRDALVTAGWFQLLPTADTIVRFAGVSVPDPAALLTAIYREALT